MSDGVEGFERTARFPTTSWTAIIDARDPRTGVSRYALGKLCSSYWYPIFAFIRRKGLDPDRARDYTQDFFTALLDGDYLANVERSKGRFRSFLLAAVSHFVANQFDAQRAQKRGGGRQLLPLELETGEINTRYEPAYALTPEALFEYQWAANVLERTLKRLRTGYSDRDFEVLKPFLVGEAVHGQGSSAAAQVGMSEGAFKVAIHRLRKRYRAMLRVEIAETVAGAAQIEDEIRYLLRILSRGHGHVL